MSNSIDSAYERLMKLKPEIAVALGDRSERGRTDGVDTVKLAQSQKYSAELAHGLLRAP